MKIGMEYRLGGRKVSKAAFERHIREAPLEAVKDSVKRAVSRARCPVHHTTGTVRFTKVGSELRWEVVGCCDQLTTAVRRALR